MPSFDMTGTVKLVMDPQTFDSGFTKREFVVTTEGERYPQEIKFECVKDRVSLLDQVQPGNRVVVSFDLRGNEYNGRYYVNLTAWKVVPEDEGAPGDSPGNGPSDSSGNGPPLENLEPPASDIDEMPF